MKYETVKTAPWYRAKNGAPTARKSFKRIAKYSKRNAARARVYSKRVKAWKEGKGCRCAGMTDSAGRLICRDTPHKCEDNHHSRGKLGELLMDERWWIPVCRTAHDWLGRNIEEARRVGLLPPKGEWNSQPKEQPAA